MANCKLEHIHRLSTSVYLFLEVSFKMIVLNNLHKYNRIKLLDRHKNTAKSLSCHSIVSSVPTNTDGVCSSSPYSFSF